MTGEEIREIVSRNNLIIESNRLPMVFILNELVSKALEENHRLRTICPHKFDDYGNCIYCDAKEKI